MRLRKGSVDRIFRRVLQGGGPPPLLRPSGVQVARHLDRARVPREDEDGYLKTEARGHLLLFLQAVTQQYYPLVTSWL